MTNLSERQNTGPDAFVGTAAYYARYRVPYPQNLLHDLIRRTNVTGQGRLLDLASGPGRVALAISSSFRDVWAVDREPEMIEVGKAEAMRRGVSNVTWTLGRAEDLRAPADSFELITIGEAFHRLDQRFIAARSLRWLNSGSCLAVIGCSDILSGREAWQRVAVSVAERWTRHAFPSGWATSSAGASRGTNNVKQVLTAAAFEDVLSYSFVEPYDWTVDAIIGYLHSTSVCSRRILAGNLPAFDSELRSELHALNSTGIFHERIRFGYTLGRKPIRDTSEH